MDAGGRHMNMLKSDIGSSEFDAVQAYREQQARFALSRNQFWGGDKQWRAAIASAVAYADEERLTANTTPSSLLLELAAQRIAAEAGSEGPQDAERYRRYARAALSVAASTWVSNNDDEPVARAAVA